MTFHPIPRAILCCLLLLPGLAGRAVVLAQMGAPASESGPPWGLISVGVGVALSIFGAVVIYRLFFRPPTGPPPIPVAEETVKPLSLESSAPSADAPRPSQPVRAITPPPPPKPTVSDDDRPRAGREPRTIGPRNLPPPPVLEPQRPVPPAPTEPHRPQRPIRASSAEAVDEIVLPDVRRKDLPPRRPVTRATAAAAGDEIVLPDVRRKDLPPPRRIPSKIDPGSEIEIVAGPPPPPLALEQEDVAPISASAWDPYAEVAEEFADVPQEAEPTPPPPALVPEASAPARTGFDGKEWGSIDVVSGDDAGSSFALHGEEIFIGRRVDGEYDMPLHDQYVSRVHGAIRRSLGTVTYTDLGSRGGSLVNQVAATAETPVTLKPQDTIYIGETALRLTWKVTGLEAWDLPDEEY